MKICMLLHKSVEHDSRVRREAEALQEAGHDVTVIELAPGSRRVEPGGYWVSAIYPPGWVKRAMPSAGYRLVFLAQFVLAIRGARPDVVHAHDAAMLVPGYLGARLTGARLVYDSHELATGVPYHNRGWARLVAGVERVIVPRCDAVITVSDGIADRLQERYRLDSRPRVVRNVSALARREKSVVSDGLRGRLGIDTRPLILHQGAPAPARGCENLVRALREVPRAHLVFLGSEDAPGFIPRLAELAEECEVATRVHFVPSVPLDGLLEYTREADVGVSLLEGDCENHRLALPNKVFEYVAAGVPVVASALPELDRLVDDHGIGWTVDSSDPEEIAVALRNALSPSTASDVRRRLTEAARRLTWAVERDRLGAVYARLDPLDV